MASDSGSKPGRELGPTGETVRHNIRRLRTDARMPLTELSADLGEAGRPIPVLGVRRIEDGTRRVDVDDLVAIAAALGVSPITLLMPVADADETVTATTVGELSAHQLFSWLRGAAPLPSQRETATQARTLPKWLIDEERKDIRADVRKMMRLLLSDSERDDLNEQLRRREKWSGDA